MENRTFVIGDIHGGLKALEQLLDKVNLLKSDTFIFLGDLVDGWSESAQTIQYLIEFSKKYKCIFIKGNHDAWCEDWLMKGRSNPTWLLHGGASTVVSYKGLEDDKKLEHLSFFNEMKDYYIDSENRLFIHAGFSSMHGPEKEVYRSNYSWDRTLWEMVVALDEKLSVDSVLYPKRLKLFKEIYIGHTPTTDFGSTKPINKANVWNLDTGAAFKGCLSIMEINNKDTTQSSFVYELYPTEKGRN